MNLRRLDYRVLIVADDFFRRLPLLAPELCRQLRHPLRCEAEALRVRYDRPSRKMAAVRSAVRGQKVAVVVLVVVLVVVVVVVVLVVVLVEWAVGRGG